MAEATQKTANYTAEMVDSMIEMYNELGNDGLDEIADSLGKSLRSVRSKLVREGVYVASPKKTAAKQDGPSKKEILREIEDTGFDVSRFRRCYESSTDSSNGCGSSLSYHYQGQLCPSQLNGEMECGVRLVRNSSGSKTLYDLYK